MGITHIRLPKNFDLDERLERYAGAIERDAGVYKGRWAEACCPLAVDGGGALRRYGSVHLDLGCGKGAFVVACAERDPEGLYIGMDAEPVCIAYAAQAVAERDLPNAVIVPLGADALARVFAEGELAGITLNFPTPHPKRHHARKRLVHVDRLLAYRPLLAPGATVTLRTDSQPLWEYAKGQFDAAGYRARCGHRPTWAASTPASRRPSTSAA